jgi:hypothetical protein
MENNLDILTDENIEIIRQRHLGLDADDDSRDDEINEMSQEEVCACLIGWSLGSDSWLDSFIMHVAEATGKDEEDIKGLLFEDYKG